jgi:hypothetical protein
MSAPAQPKDPDAVEVLHAFYCRQLQETVILRDNWKRLWLEYLRAGFDLDQLTLVLKYLLREVRAGRRNPGALKLSNLLQVDRFEEDLLLARLQRRPDKPPEVKQPASSQNAHICRKETVQEHRKNLDLLRACRIQLARRLPPNPEPFSS